MRGPVLGLLEHRRAEHAVHDDETLSDVIAEFERASQRSRVIASRFDLEDTNDNPRKQSAPSTAGSVTFGQGSAPFITR